MIIGVGTDLCDIERMAGVLERQGERFRRRICSEREVSLEVLTMDQAAYFAGLFAAKEACAKALGTGITDRVGWRHIEVLISQSGEPSLTLGQGAARRAKRLAAGRDVRADLVITRSSALAAAFVLLTLVEGD